MRIVIFQAPGSSENRVGVQKEAGSGIADVTAATASSDVPVGSSTRLLLEVLHSDAHAASGAKAIVDALVAAVMAGTATGLIEESSVTLRAPIYDPEKVICIGMNYVDHCLEQGFPIPKEPVVFNKWPSTIIAPGDDIVHPRETVKLDYEVELVIVVGKGGRRIAREDAMAAVAGYTVSHDVSARDWQLEKNGGQWLLGKAFDTFMPIGPAIVTTDSLPGGDPHKLPLRCILNGTTVQESNTEQLIFKTEELIAWCSKFFTLRPGDLISTGTPPGVGCFRKPQLWLKPGDSVTCEVDGIGSITNRVIGDSAAEADTTPAAAAAATSSST